MGRAVQAVDEAVDDGARQQFEVPDPRQGRRIHELGAAHRGPRVPSFHRHIPDFGAGTEADQPIDDLVGRHALGLGVEVREDAVAHHGMRQRPDVLERHVVAPVDERARLGAEDEILRGAHAGAVGHPFLDEVERAGGMAAARAHKRERVAHHGLGDRARAARAAGTRAVRRPSPPATPWRPAPPSSSAAPRALRPRAGDRSRCGT